MTDIDIPILKENEDLIKENKKLKEENIRLKKELRAWKRYRSNIPIEINHTTYIYFLSKLLGRFII